MEKFMDWQVMDVKEYFKCDFALTDLFKVEVRLL